MTNNPQVRFTTVKAHTILQFTQLRKTATISSLDSPVRQSLFVDAGYPRAVSPVVKIEGSHEDKSETGEPYMEALVLGSVDAARLLSTIMIEHPEAIPEKNREDAAKIMRRIARFSDDVMPERTVVEARELIMQTVAKHRGSKPGSLRDQLIKAQIVEVLFGLMDWESEQHLTARRELAELTHRAEEAARG